MTVAQTINETNQTTKNHDWRIIITIGVVHASSHFFQLVLPTLYLSLSNEFGYEFTELGLLVSIFFLVSCLGQASSGFIVDRVGPAPIMYFGLGSFVVAALLIATANGYVMLLLAALIAGIGNSIFHPVDYSIINHRVTPKRLGHAFSVHGLTGYVGWALTPVFMATLIYWFNWRIATLGVAVLMVVVLLIALASHSLFKGKNIALSGSDNSSNSPNEKTQSQQQSSINTSNIKESNPVKSKTDLSNQSAWETFVSLVSTPTLWGAFLFFACLTIALSSVQNYTIPLLGKVYGIDKVMAGSVLSAYMMSAALGMFAGGFLVGANPKTERIVAISLVMAGFFLLLLATGNLPPILAMLLVGVAGFSSGLSSPSRDMLIRKITPKGATGAVYGLVYSGMDVGSSLAPTMFGFMLDKGFDYAPWIGAAIAFCVAALLAVWIAKSANKMAAA